MQPATPPPAALTAAARLQMDRVGNEDVGRASAFVQGLRWTVQLAKLRTIAIVGAVILWRFKHILQIIGASAFRL